MPTPVKAKVDSDTQKYIVRPQFSVLMERGQSKNYHIGGDVIDLTTEEADRVANQIEPYSDEALERDSVLIVSSGFIIDPPLSLSILA